MLNWTYSLVALLILVVSGEGVAKTAVNRLVVEVNGVAYSQRQVELFFLVQKIAGAFATEKSDWQIESFRGAPNTQDWMPLLRIFTEQMAIYQEGRRIGLQLGERSLVETLMPKVYAQLEREPELQKIAARLVLTDEDWKLELGRQLGVGAYTKRRQQSEAAFAATSKGSQNWRRDILRRAMTRRFSGAEIYEPIDLSTAFRTGHK